LLPITTPHFDFFVLEEVGLEGVGLDEVGLDEAGLEGVGLEGVGVDEAGLDKVSLIEYINTWLDNIECIFYSCLHILRFSIFLLFIYNI
jgi:hypothetical protein